MPAERPPINPPHDYSVWWWVALAVAVVVLAALAVWNVVASARERARAGGDTVETLRGQVLAEIAALAELASTGELSARAAAGRIGARVRAFVALASGSDADYATGPELRSAARRDPRLAATADFTDWLEPQLFAPPTDQPLDVALVRDRAAEVVTSWS